MARKIVMWLAAIVAVFALVYTNRATVLTTVVDAYGLSQSFVGVTTDGAVRGDLFHIKPTGVSMAPVREAAQQFLASLDMPARAQASFAVDDDEWRRWMNIHLYDRQGVGFLDMNAPAKTAGYKLLQESLSARGYAQIRNIMKLDTTLGELNGDAFEWYGEERFWLSMMGTPSAAEPWGWQIDGHHLVINYFVLADQVVMSPVFLGAEPVVARSGKHAGVAVLQNEQDAALGFVNMLTPAQRTQAIIERKKTGNNAVGEFYSDNVVVPQVGLLATQLDDRQRQGLIALIELFVGHLRDDHARIKMVEVLEHIDETFFAWVGSTADDAVFYYRIHSPVLLIEFDHQNPIGLRHMATTDGPQRNHIHALIRTPNGNDYGKDLLRQHYERVVHRPE